MNLFVFLFALAFWKNPPYSFYTSIERASPQEEEALSFALPYLSQPFEFIGEGAQVIAFASGDGKTVLKIFKAGHQKSFKLSRWVKKLRNFKENSLISKVKWQEKFRATTCRYEIAFNELKEETGLIGLHFKASSTPLPAQLVMKGHTTTIDLRELPFILQERATLLPTYLETLVQEGHIQEALAVIEGLKKLFVRRTLKGFTDPRQSLSVNYGYSLDHGQPMQIDVGKIERMPVLKEHPEAEIKRIHNHVDLWVEAHFPKLVEKREKR